MDAVVVVVGTVGSFAAWIVTNAVCLALSLFILMMTLLPTRKRDAVAAALDPAKGGAP